MPATSHPCNLLLCAVLDRFLWNCRICKAAAGAADRIGTTEAKENLKSESTDLICVLNQPKLILLIGISPAMSRSAISDGLK